MSLFHRAQHSIIHVLSMASNKGLRSTLLTRVLSRGKPSILVSVVQFYPRNRVPLLASFSKPAHDSMLHALPFGKSAGEAYCWQPAAWKAGHIKDNKQTNKHLRCGNRKGLLGRNDQTHHRMGPKTMDSTPPIKRNTQAYNQQITRRIYLFPNQTQSRAPTKQDVQ